MRKYIYDPILEILIQVIRCCAQRNLISALRIRIFETLFGHKSDIKNCSTNFQKRDSEYVIDFDFKMQKQSSFVEPIA